MNECLFIPLVFPFLTPESYPAALTTTITMTSDSVTFPRVPTSQAAVPQTVSSVYPYRTLWEEKQSFACNFRMKQMFMLIIISGTWKSFRQIKKSNKSKIIWKAREKSEIKIKGNPFEIDLIHIKFTHEFTVLKHIAFPSCQTTSVTMTNYFITYPGISTRHAAILNKIISKHAGNTLCQIKKNHFFW